MKRSSKINSAQGIILAGMQSGSGKTATTCLILSALRQRGVSIQPFKVGPDFLDPQYHRHFAGKPSRNLDSWLMGKPGVVREVEKAGADCLGIVEGVMGFFDGSDVRSDEGSTFEISKELNWPVILIVPAAKAGRSIAASIRGFIDQAGKGKIQGLIFSGVSGESHADYLSEAVASLKIPILGAIPTLPELRWPERHLGLQALSELDLPSWKKLAKVAEKYLKVDEILSFNGRGELRESNVFRPLDDIQSIHPSYHSLASHPLQEVPERPKIKSSTRHFTTISHAGLAELISPVRRKTTHRIAIARDEAFHFYYEGNLATLEDEGVEWVPFSPLHDKSLPSSIDGVVLGGGFPEVFAPQLSKNRPMRGSFAKAIQSGLPCYAECGGLMWLSQEMMTLDGKKHPMVGLLPGRVEMTPRLQNFGYCTCVTSNGIQVKGHEFHHSRWIGESKNANLWRVTRKRDQSSRMEGYRYKNLHASYIHLDWCAAKKILKPLFEKPRKSKL
ncbi:MAG: cobyrinate a,c-diamide synthase [Verrucomicrobiota bacterium]